jgi:hypothetical protein
LIKVVDEDNALASETTSEEYEDSAGCEGLAELGWTDGLADL